MNSLDPWRVIVTDPHGDVVVPRPHYGHPFYGPYTHGPYAYGRTFIGASGANMTNIGAELTALSAPGYASPGFGLPRYGYPFYSPFGPYAGPYFGPYLGAEAPPPGAVVAPPPGSQPVAAPVVIPVPPGGSVEKADPGRTGLLAQIAPIVAPATGTVAVKKELDAGQVLHVEICVDGKCYKTSMDLAPALELVMKRLSQWHESVHAPPPPPTTVVQAVEKAIGAATDSMVGVMVGHHVAVMTSGWLSDVGNALGSTLRKLQPVITTVAVGVATAYGGEKYGAAAGAAAGKLAPVITNYQADALDPKGSPKKRAAAQQALQRINQAAANDPDPTAAQAVAAANQAVKNTTVAYHVKDTAQRAADGDPAAQKDIDNLVVAAEEGDPAAKSTYEVLALTFAQEMMKSEEGAKLWEKVTGRGPGTISPLASAPTSAPTAAAGWYDVVGGTVIVGGFWSSVKDGLLKVTLVKQTNQFIKDNKLEPYVQLAANAISSYYGGPAGVAASNVVTPMMMKVGVKDEDPAAQQKLQSATAAAQEHPQMAAAVEIAKEAAESAAVAYQVAQITKDARAGNPEAQKALADLQAAADRGDQQAAMALQAAAVIDQEQQQSTEPDTSDTSVGPSMNGWYNIAGTVIGMAAIGCSPYGPSYGPPYGTAVGQWYEVIGAAIDDFREKARAHAVTKPGTAAGVLITVDGRLHGRGFRNLDDAIDWLGHITRNRGAFTYAAAYEKDADGAAYIQAEEVGGTTQQAPISSPIPRGAPATVAG